MNKQQRLAIGIVAGVAGAAALARMMRGRRAIAFTDRVVVITGGSRGLGLVLARQFADEGARLCLLARDPGELLRAREELEARGAAAMTVRCDVRRRGDVRAAVDAIVEQWGGVDVLVNNAGVIQVGPFEHMTHEDFENAMATHFWGPLNLMLEVVPIMRHRGFGRIVNISSIGGRIAVPHLGPYSASKFALVGLSDSARSELSRHGIRVTTVAPGLMRTGSPMNAQMKGRHRAEYAWFAIADSIPGLSIDAERAASQILDACRHGDAELTITPQAKLAVMANAVAPGAVARAMAIVSRLLPPPTGMSGDVMRKGRESESRWAPSLATRLSDRAAVANNEV
ncbi:MAG TPA: SDR family oxidoreductase [Vicinamibacterales bacterium]|nr:SDR family oxidoreductase [Vicinamibacterales bacterium]